MREVGVSQSLEDVSVVDSGVAVGHFDVPPGFERGEEVGGAVVLVLVVLESWAERIMSRANHPAPSIC